MSVRDNNREEEKEFQSIYSLESINGEDCDTQRIKIRSVLGERKRKRKRKERRRKQSFNLTTCLRHGWRGTVKQGSWQQNLRANKA